MHLSAFEMYIINQLDYLVIIEAVICIGLTIRMCLNRRLIYSLLFFMLLVVVTPTTNTAISMMVVPALQNKCQAGTTIIELDKNTKRAFEKWLEEHKNAIGSSIECSDNMCKLR